MAKRIVVLNGSPRKSGNTAGLVKAFVEGAEGAGHSVTVFYLDEMNLNGCKGCLCGQGKEASPCVQKDDMDLIYPAISEANVVIWASPLYWWTISGQLRVAIDRLFALAEGGGTGLYGKECALLMAAEGDGFENVSAYFDMIMEKIHWKNLGKVLASGVTRVGDIDKDEAQCFVDQARALGASL